MSPSSHTGVYNAALHFDVILMLQTVKDALEECNPPSLRITSSLFGNSVYSTAHFTTICCPPFLHGSNLLVPYLMG
jgi:hypothetical protein